jgi:hypothetical protein
MTRRFLTLALISAVAIPVSVVVHNCLAALMHAEEPVFFLIAVVVAPLGLFGGLVGAAICTVVSRRRRARGA